MFLWWKMKNINSRSSAAAAPTDKIKTISRQTKANNINCVYHSISYKIVDTPPYHTTTTQRTRTNRIPNSKRNTNNEWISRFVPTMPLKKRNRAKKVRLDHSVHKAKLIFCVKKKQKKQKRENEKPLNHIDEIDEYMASNESSSTQDMEINRKRLCLKWIVTFTA